MKSLSYRLWEYLDKKTSASSIACRLHRRLSEKLLKNGEIDLFYPLALKEAYQPDIPAIRTAYKKYFSLQLFENAMETLVVGSSHGYYGYHADEKRHEINACDISQDLYYSYELYKKYADAPHLKNIVLFYSVFSSGHLLEACCERKLCDPYAFIYGIPYRFSGACENEKMKEAFAVLIGQMREKPDFHHVGNVPENVSFFSIPAKEEAEDHLKCNRRDENQTFFVEKAIALAKEKGHNLYIVVPPARSDYMNCVPSYEELFSELTKLNDRVKILSLFGDKRFEDSDFGDSDHLNAKGAEKLTAFVREFTGG